MRTPTHDSESDHSADYVDCRVEYHRGSSALMDTAFAEDLRYWSDGTETPIGDDRIFLRRPQDASFVPVETRDGVGLGKLLLPEEWLTRLEIPYTPIEMEFLMVRPEFSSQLERRY